MDERMAQRQFRLDGVAVSAPISLAGHVALVDQIGKNLVALRSVIRTAEAKSRSRMPGSRTTHKST
jgi:hypothetical protein